MAGQDLGRTPCHTSSLVPARSCSSLRMLSGLSRMANRCPLFVTMNALDPDIPSRARVRPAPTMGAAGPRLVAVSPQRGGPPCNTHSRHPSQIEPARPVDAAVEIAKWSSARTEPIDQGRDWTAGQTTPEVAMQVIDLATALVAAGEICRGRRAPGLRPRFYCHRPVVRAPGREPPAAEGDQQ